MSKRYLNVGSERSPDPLWRECHLACATNELTVWQTCGCRAAYWLTGLLAYWLTGLLAYWLTGLLVLLVLLVLLGLLAARNWQLRLQPILH